MKRKTSVGLYVTIISIIAAIVGMIYYMMNCGTAYFGNLGVNPVVAGCIIAAIVIQIVLIAVGMKGQPTWADILPVASSVLLMLGTVNFVSARVNGIAAILTFENNAENMADLNSAIIGIAACLIATIISIVASFFDITKETA